MPPTLARLSARCHVPTDAQVDVPGAPSVADLHAEYVASGGRFSACPVCVNLRGLQDSTWVDTAEVRGAPSVDEYTSGRALVFTHRTLR